MVATFIPFLERVSQINSAWHIFRPKAFLDLLKGSPGMCTLKSDMPIFPQGAPVAIAAPYGWKEHKVIRLKSAKNSWANLPKDLDSGKEFSFFILGKEHFCLVHRAKGKDILIISKRRDYKKYAARVNEKQWSPWIKVKENTTDAVFRVRPIKIDCSKDSVQLYVSPVNRCHQFSDPKECGNKLYSNLGVYQEPLNISALLVGWLDSEGLVNEFREQAIWQAKATIELTKNMGFTGVLSKWHAFDKFYHFFFQKIDPVAPSFNKEQFNYYENIHKNILKIADEMVGYVLKEKDDETLLVVCSDHGLMPSARHASVPNLLVKHNFTVLKKKIRRKPEIDWKKTKAVLHPYVQIWVNLNGRDPQGIVSPGSEYEKVRDDIIKLLRGWKDTKTGDYVIAHVFRTEDGAFYGLGGGRDGDIRFFASPGYSVYRNSSPSKDGILVKDAYGPYMGDHGSCEPTTRFGRGSETAMIGMYGHGIRHGHTPKLYPKLIDIIPTICYLCGLPLPADSEGAVLRNLFI